MESLRPTCKWMPDEGNSVGIWPDFRAGGLRMGRSGAWLAAATLLAIGCGGSTDGGNAGKELPGLVIEDVHLEVVDVPGALEAVAPDAETEAAGDPATDLAAEAAGDTVVDAVPEKGLVKPGYIYAHTGGELYSWVPSPTTQPKKVGSFLFPNDGLDHTMTDMAIDYDGRLYGVTYEGLYRCDADSAKCENLASFSEQFNGMTIVPAGTIQANVETIVAISNAGGWYRVDVQGTKAVLTHQGDYGSGYSSAGDAYSIEGVGTYAAVNGGGSGTALVQVDPKTGAVLKELGDIPGNSIWGLAGMGNKVYAFDDDGTIYLGDTTSGSSFKSYLKTDIGWYGAAVSTRGH